MHIADVTMFWAPASGGVRTYLEYKTDWLSRQAQFRHTLMIPGAVNCREAGTLMLPATAMPFGHGYRFPLRSGQWTEALVELAPDIIEAEDPYVLPWAALAAARRLQVPVVGFYHSDLPRLVGSRAGDWTNHWLNSYVAKLYRQFDRVLAPSQVMADKLRELGLDQVRLQPLGVDIVLFNPRHRSAALRRQLQLDNSTRLLIFAGRGSHEKNLPVLFKAMVMLGKHYHLHLVGSQLPRRLPVNVSKTDYFVDQVRLAEMLASSDVLVHAGDRETFGLIVLEAMASGIPVVGVGAGAVAELVVPGTGLLAAPQSPESLANAIRSLIADGWQESGRRARRHVEQYYTWQRVLPQLVGHYRELIGHQLLHHEAKYA